jgi:hypothetical protein
MGFWISIRGGEKSDEELSDKKSLNPFAVSLSFAPMRLSANRRHSVDLLVKVKNVSPETHLLSVDALLPKDALLGFDEACINKVTEKRVGEVRSGDSIEVPITIWGSNQTKEGNYGVGVTVYSHYMDYDKVLSYTKKSASLRSV